MGEPKVIKSAKFLLTVELVEEDGKRYYVASCDRVVDDCECKVHEPRQWFVTETTRKHNVEELSRHIAEAFEILLEEIFEVD